MNQQKVGDINKRFMRSRLSSSFLLIVLLQFSCEAQPKNVTDDMRNECINSIVHQTVGITMANFKCIADRDTSDFQIRPADSANFINNIIKINSILTKEDADFMWQQVADYNAFALDQSKFTDRTIIYLNKYKELSGAVYWDKIESEYHTDTFCSFDAPLFSKDLSTVIISSWFYQDFRKGHGMSYALYVYKKKNGKWEFFKQLAFAD